MTLQAPRQRSPVAIRSSSAAHEPIRRARNASEREGGGLRPLAACRSGNPLPPQVTAITKIRAQSVRSLLCRLIS
jgi:hypothetical protein